LTDHGQQLLAAERLGQGEIGTEVLGDLEEVHVLGAHAAGNGDNFDVGPLLTHFTDRFDAFFFGHEDVGDHQIWLVGGKHVDGLAAVAGLANLIALQLQAGTDLNPHHFLIVNEQDLRRHRHSAL